MWLCHVLIGGKCLIKQENKDFRLSPKTNLCPWFIYQSMLCGKLSGDLKEVMDKTMKIIHFIRANSSTKHLHWNLNPLMMTSYSTMMCTDLNSGSKLWIFLKQSKSNAGATDHLHIMCKTENKCKIAFLADIFSCLNPPNVLLQVKEKSVGYGGKVCCLWEQIDLSHADLLLWLSTHWRQLV